MNNILELTDEQLRELFEKKVKSLRVQLQKAEMALAAYTNDLVTPLDVDNKLVNQESSLNLIKPDTSIIKGKKYTLSEKAEHVLNVEQCPLTSKELMELINRTFDDKHYLFNKFSGQWSILYRKPTKNFDKIIFEKNSFPLRQLYCLKEWMKGESLLPKYKDALIHKHENEMFE